MLNAVGQAQHILLLGGTSDIGLAIVSELASRGGSPTVLSLIHISEPTRRTERSRMPSSA